MRFFATYTVFVPLAIAHRRYEALQAAPGDLMPRFFIDRSFPLAKRAGDCGSGNHNCKSHTLQRPASFSTQTHIA